MKFNRLYILTYGIFLLIFGYIKMWMYESTDADFEHRLGTILLAVYCTTVDDNKK